VAWVIFPITRLGPILDFLGDVGFTIVIVELGFILASYHPSPPPPPDRAL